MSGYSTFYNLDDVYNDNNDMEDTYNNAGTIFLNYIRVLQ